VIVVILNRKHLLEEFHSHTFYNFFILNPLVTVIFKSLDFILLSLNNSFSVKVGRILVSKSNPLAS
jgi:hypothetical protein